MGIILAQNEGKNAKKQIIKLLIGILFIIIATVGFSIAILYENMIGMIIGVISLTIGILLIFIKRSPDSETSTSESADNIEYRTCSYCGKGNSSEAEICEYCGANL